MATIKVTNTAKDVGSESGADLWKIIAELNSQRFDSTFRGMDLRQTKAKLKKGSQGLNLLRFIKLASLFAVSTLLTYCRGACPGAATVPTESSNISGISGSTSSVLPNRGYSLTKAKIWKNSDGNDDKSFRGIELTYSSDCCNLADVVHMYGITASYVYSKDITQKVKEVLFIYKNNGDTEIRDIWFTLGDNTTLKICDCAGNDCSNQKKITLTGNLIGLATKYSSSLNGLDAEIPELSVWVDSVA